MGWGEVKEWEMARITQGTGWNQQLKEVRMKEKC